MDNIDIIEQNVTNLSLELLKILLKDKTTNHYIRWATDNYRKYGPKYYATQEIKPDLVIGKNIIQPRVMKAQEEQSKRTRDKAEVFTPSWICNEQNNLIDDAWFGRKGVFNYTDGTTWSVNLEPVRFPEGKTWKQYVDARRLEVSCGEAPYLVSRYDTVNGTPITIEHRIGLLDRKLRVINENVDDEDEWFKWVIRAFQSIYAYEYQGDNVLLARANLLYTFIDNMIYKFQHKPTLEQLKEIAKIIVWNVWQMDGISLTAPYSESKSICNQLTLFDGLDDIADKGYAIPCKIFDWRSNYSLEFQSMMKGD